MNEWQRILFLKSELSRRFYYLVRCLYSKQNNTWDSNQISACTCIILYMYVCYSNPNSDQQITREQTLTVKWWRHVYQNLTHILLRALSG